jgi:putative flippase GtrA
VPVTRLRTLYTTFRALIHEIAKFGVVGLVNYFIDIAIFNALVLQHVNPVLSKTISYSFATTISYFANRHWTWRHRARTGLFREYRLFVALSAVSLGITLAPLAVVEYGLGMHSLLARNLSANVVGVGLATVFRFWSFKRWVFLAPADEQPPMSPGEATLRTTA